MNRYRCVCVCVCLKAGNPSRPSQKCHQSKSCTALQHWHAVMTSGMPGMLELDVIALLLYLVCKKCRAGGKVRTKWFAFFRSSETRSVASVFFVYQQCTCVMVKKNCHHTRKVIILRDTVFETQNHKVISPRTNHFVFSLPLWQDIFRQQN